MDATYALVVMLSTGPAKGGWVGMGDYNTAAQCETARDAAAVYWKETHEAGYRVKFGAECILTIGAE